MAWQALRGGKGWPWGLLGAAVLVFYGVIPTLQRPHFGRVYAAYGGIFVVLSLLWAWWFDRTAPDGPDAVGALLCLLGVGVIMYWPRG